MKGNFIRIIQNGATAASKQRQAEAAQLILFSVLVTGCMKFSRCFPTL